MTATISYTPEEVAKILKISRFTVYEMIKRGDFTAYRIGRKMRIDAPDLDAYIQKSKGLSPAATLARANSSSTGAEKVLNPSLSSAEQTNSLPPVTQPPPANTFIICGQDVLLDILAKSLEKELPQIRFLRDNSGSLDGLLALYRGSAQLVTAHLWDSDTDTYNTPYVRRILPGQKTIIINLAYRVEGFYVAQGNPLALTAWQDLAKPGIRLVNREPGSGARVLLDEQLHVLNIEHHRLLGYKREETSHMAVASCIARGEADVGIGIEKVSRQVNNLDFIPLQKERYDLVVRAEDEEKPYFPTLLAILRSPLFHSQLAGMGGYDLAQTGQIMAKT